MQRRYSSPTYKIPWIYAPYGTVSTAACFGVVKIIVRILGSIVGLVNWPPKARPSNFDAKPGKVQKVG